MPKAKGGMLLGIFASLWILDIFLPYRQPLDFRYFCLGFCAWVCLVCRSVVFVYCLGTEEDIFFFLLYMSHWSLSLIEVSSIGL